MGNELCHWPFMQNLSALRYFRLAGETNERLLARLEAVLAPEGADIERSYHLIRLAPAEKYRKICQEIVEAVPILDSAAGYWDHLQIFENKMSVQVETPSKIAMYWNRLCTPFQSEIQRMFPDLESVAEDIPWRTFMGLVQQAIKAPTMREMAREAIKKWAQGPTENAEAAVNRLIQLYREAQYSIDGETAEAEKNREEIIARIQVGLDQKSHIVTFVSNWISSITGTASLKDLMVRAEKHERTRRRAQELRYQQQATARAEQTVDTQKGRRGGAQPMEIDQIQEISNKEGGGGARKKSNQGRTPGQAKDWVKSAKCH